MSEKTRLNNAREDELNQARFLVERGTQVSPTEAPGDDEGNEIESEELIDTKARFREQPPKEESDIASQSEFYGQGFEAGDDKGIKREAKPESKDERGSLG